MNTRASFLWTLAVTVLANACAQDLAVAKRKYFESGNQYFDQQKYAEANLDEAQQWWEKGQAMLYLQQSLDLDPNNPVYQYHLGMALARKGDDGKARRVLQRALQLDPKFAGAAHARKTLDTLVY